MSKKAGKVIISCALTGAVHTPTMSKYLPITPDEIAQQGVEAVKAGAAILHIHARDPKTGVPTPDPSIYSQILVKIKDQCSAILNITTGGGMNMQLADRLKAAMATKPEMCSLNMGSMNFGLFPMAEKYSTWKHDWEKPYLENTSEFIFRNTFKDIANIVSRLGEHGTMFEYECYDIGHLYNLAYFLDKGLVKPPLFVQTIFGTLGGIGTSPENLVFMKQTADKLFGDNYVWSVLATGKHQLPYATKSALMGGNVRVGLEDSLYIGKKEFATSNAQQVSKIKQIIETFSLETATPDETRDILSLKGMDQVGF